MRAWLFSIMHNLQVDRVRAPKLDAVALDGGTPEVSVGPAQGERLAVRDLQPAFTRLPLKQKQVVLLVALEDMAYADIADTLGIPVGTVMSRLSRGRDRLGALLSR